METTPEQLINYVLNRLKLPLYGVLESRLEEMERLAQRVTIYQLKRTPDFQTIALYNDGNRPLASISVRSVPQVVDAPPLFQDGERVELSPALVLTEDADTWTRLHEICHLCSIGPYLPLTEGRFSHYFGIHTVFYRLRNGRMEKRTSNGHSGINELLTDYAAWHFMRLLYGDASPFYSGTERFGTYADTLFGGDMRPEILIGRYVSGDARSIAEVLLTGRYREYESLYRALFQ